MKLTEKLYQLRKENGLSQLEVSEVLGVSRQTISKWELGTSLPSTKNLIALSNLYGVGMDFMVDDGVQLEAAPPPQIVAVKEVKESGPPPHTALRYILWTICFLAVCAVVCVIVLTLGRPAGKDEKDAIPISELEREKIDTTSVEDYSNLESW